MPLLSPFSATWRNDVARLINTGAILIKGTTTNDSAAAGYVGELIESEILVANAVALTSATAKNVTSVSLTAGNWHVWANVILSVSGGAAPTAFTASINTTTDTQPTPPAAGGYATIRTSLTANLAQGLPISGRDMKLSATTTVYLVTTVVFASGAVSAYGYLGARRVR